MRLIKGELDPDEGQLIRSSEFAAATVSQIPEVDLDNSVYGEALTSFEPLQKVEKRLEDIEHVIAEQHGADEVAAEYDRLRTYFEIQGGYDYESRTERVLYGLGFSEQELEYPCSNLSGGQLSRLALAVALLSPATVLLLDEPTNHLDLSGSLWLMDYLRELRRTFIVISHDRYFLNIVTNRTWEIEEKTLFEVVAETLSVETDQIIAQEGFQHVLCPGQDQEDIRRRKGSVEEKSYWAFPAQLA